MKCSAERRTKVKFPVETLLVFAFEEDNKPAGSWTTVDIKLQTKFAEAAKADGFQGKEKEVLVFRTPDGKPAHRVVVAGLGSRKKFDAEKLRRAAGNAVSKLKVGEGGPVVLLPLEERLAVEPGEQGTAVAEGIALALYDFRKYRSKSDPGGELDSLRVLVETDRQRDEVDEGLRRGQVYSEATALTRDLVNEPAGTCTPRYLAGVAASLAKKGVGVKVFDEKKIRQMRMGGVEGVSLGSKEPPRVVHMTYKPTGAKKTVALVGKGITFDSGGLCLKPADGMLHMKNDMAGAGAVIGIMSALPTLRPKVEVHGIFAATENMPGQGAYKVRDVLRARNGKTMEIINTDAEGRVVLSDALSYASELDPDEIIDLATLTGACVVALGTEISGLFSNDPDLVARISASARATGEKVWQMPLEDEYFELIKSDVADMKNVGPRWGGSITAALFLKEFVGDGISWAHIDIAGPALREKGSGYLPAGGTGVMVRTMLRYLETA